MPIPATPAEAATALRQLADLVEAGTARITAYSSMRVQMTGAGREVNKQVVSLTVEYTASVKRVIKDRGRRRALPPGGR